MGSDKGVVYSPREVAEVLKIDASTLRKYAGILEGEGYHFHKNGRGHRGYFDKDLIALKRLIEFSKNNDMTLENAAIAVISGTDGTSVAVNDTTDVALQNEIQGELIDMKTVIEKQTELIYALTQRLDKQEERLNQRDERLMSAIREIQVSNRQIAATKKKKKWWFWQ